MQGKPWRVVWCDSEGNELNSKDFVHESEARRRMERWAQEHPGNRVKLYRQRWVSGPASEEAPDDIIDLIDER